MKKIRKLKVEECFSDSESPTLIKYFRMVRFTVFFFFLSLIQVMAVDSYSQTAKLSLNASNESLENVLKEIENQSEFFFLYNKDLIDVEQKVSIDATNQSIKKILVDLFDGKDISFAVYDRQIVLSNLEVINKMVAQQKTITGTVTDEGGLPLPGVTVVVKGTTTGTVTDMDGNYTIAGIPENATLLFSFVGMRSQEVAVGTQTSIDITMAVDAIGLDEVVAIGYATQKKINITGAVDVIKSEELENRPAENVAQLLQGTSPNLNISVTKLGGEPGAGSTWNIRGMGTLSGSSAPLVLVDGVQMDPNNLNPESIESVTVLKDAAASAIYGARAPFGVVLITTKKGTKDKKISFSYSNNMGFASPIGVPHFESSLNLATAFNQANDNDGTAHKFSDEQIQRIKDYSNGQYEPEYDTENPFTSMWGGRHSGNANYDWNSMYWKQNSFRQKHDISLNGGTERTQYYFSAGFYDQNGLFNYGYDEFKRYNMLANITSQVTDWLRFDFSSKFAQTHNDRPVGPFGNDDMRFFMLQAMQTFWPTMPMYNYGVDKSDNVKSISNPIVRLLQDTGRKKIVGNDSWITLGTEIEPIKNWKTKVTYNYNYFSQRNETTFLPVDVYVPNGAINNIGSSTPNYNTSMDFNDYKLFNAVSTYDKKIEKHYFKVLVGYENESYYYSNLYGSVTNLITQYVPSINTGTGNKVLSEAKGNWATEAVFGRLQYNFDEKYLIELNGRYNGSSRFAPEHRWGFFPSVSVGYNISKEDFWEPVSNVISNMKLRASYGSLGNQNVSNYLYLSTVPTGVDLNWIVGNERPMWASQPGMVSGSLTWETITTLNFGVDAYLLNNRLAVNFDWYNRTTSDMFGPAESLPAILGTTPPSINNAKMETKGWESSISWKDRISSNFSYNIKFMIGDSKSTVLEYNNPTGLIGNFYEGKELGEIWGYTTDGFIQEKGEDMPDQSLFYLSWGPGDIKYKDLDGDNVITYGEKTLDSHGDLTVIGNELPRYNIGISGGFSWKEFDFNMFWQGVGKRDLFPEYTWSSSTFWGFAGGTNNSTIFEEGHLDYWRPADETNLLGPNTDAYYPKPYFDRVENAKSRQIQTKYLLNAAYLRLKSLQVGYTIPSEITNKLYVQKFRLYCSAENLLTITKLTKLLDPETAAATRGFEGNRGIGRVYPLSRVFSFGVNITF